MVVVSLLSVGSASATTFTANPASLGAIPDGTATGPGAYGAPRDVTFTASDLAPTTPPSEVSVTFTINHTWVGDLDVSLISPDNVTKTLFSRTGASAGSPFGNSTSISGTYTISNRAPTSPTWWGAAAAPNAAGILTPGAYQPSNPFPGPPTPGANANIAWGQVNTPNGTWTLRVKDGSAGSLGSVTAASINVVAGQVSNISSLGAIPDGTGNGASAAYGSPLNVTFPVSGMLPGAPGDVKLNASITHNFLGDLDAVLIAPNGAQQTLFSRTGATTSPNNPQGSGAKLSGLAGTYSFFDGTAGNWWSAAATAGSGGTVPGGNYRTSAPGPDGGTQTTLTPSFSGVTNMNGTWILRMRDHESADTGSVTGANLQLTNANDVTAPSPPTAGGTTPGNPGNSVTPSVKGSGAEAGSTVRVYDNAACTGIPAATGTAAQFNGAGIPTPITGEGSHTFNVSAYDAFGNVSGCGPSAVGYSLDTTPPAVPTITGFSPSSPGSSTSPVLRGTAPAGTTVVLHQDVCGGAPNFVGTAAEYAGAGVQLFDLTDDGPYTFFVVSRDDAGNESACAGPVTYVLDRTAPASPTLSIPASPKKGTAFKVSGSAEAGSTVSLFQSGNCTGTPVFTGTSAALASGVDVTVPANATSSFSAKATDTAANVSACSAATSYTEDSSPPETTAKTAKAKVTTSAKKVKVRFTVGSNEPGATFACTLDGKALASCGSSVAVTVKPGLHTLRATATDKAGNADATPAKATVKVVKKKKKRHHHS